ncbi:hypothetical protein F511_19868 [Dorcoceras hygrometricum]|uniref:Uncharacterized protein n=1 Tax=Dorcoceras hygrometricum TaxID=472368 RepID=A0A2Z7ASK1_9LAMI|nr:hypothetical protein F511_19868 [Dorcoceras hygrometricum]
MNSGVLKTDGAKKQMSLEKTDVGTIQTLNSATTEHHDKTQLLLMNSATAGHNEWNATAVRLLDTTNGMQLLVMNSATADPNNRMRLLEGNSAIADGH